MFIESVKIEMKIEGLLLNKTYFKVLKNNRSKLNPYVLKNPTLWSVPIDNKKYKNKYWEL